MSEKATWTKMRFDFEESKRIEQYLYENGDLFKRDKHWTMTMTKLNQWWYDGDNGDDVGYDEEYEILVFKRRKQYTCSTFT